VNRGMNDIPDRRQEVNDLPNVSTEKTQAEIEKIRAETRKVTAEADLARMKNLLPNLSEVSAGTVTAEGDQPFSGFLLSHLALKKAATKVVARVSQVIGSAAPNEVPDLLICQDIDILSKSAQHEEIGRALEWWIAGTRQAVGGEQWGEWCLNQARDRLGCAKVTGQPGLVPPVPLAAALALPGIVSLLSVDRKLSAGAVSFDNTGAVALVAGAFQNADPQIVNVLIDSFRLLDETSDLNTKVKELHRLRVQLADRASASKAENADVLRDLLKSLDVFLASLHATQDGGMSPYAAAASFVAHSGYRLFIKAGPGAQSQMVSDRRVGPDRISIEASAGITYLLMDAEGALVAAGVENGYHVLDVPASELPNAMQAVSVGEEYVEPAWYVRAGRAAIGRRAARTVGRIGRGAAGAAGKGLRKVGEWLKIVKKKEAKGNDPKGAGGGR